MKVGLRYLSSKSPLSERRLAVASLQLLIVYSFVSVCLFYCLIEGCAGNMKVGLRYLSSKSPLSERRLAVASLQSLIVYSFVA